MKICTVPNCNRKHSAKGCCKMHYTRLLRHGDPLAVRVLVGEGYTRHGLSGTPEWIIWMGMRQRCYNPNNKDYPKYGGCGITICERWQNSFTDFLADMGQKPSPSHTLDRKNGNGNYEPGNCR